MRRSPALLLALIGGLALPPLIGMALTAAGLFVATLIFFIPVFRRFLNAP